MTNLLGNESKLHRNAYYSEPMEFFAYRKILRSLKKSIDNRVSEASALMCFLLFRTNPLICDRRDTAERSTYGQSQNPII